MEWGLVFLLVGFFLFPKYMHDGGLGQGNRNENRGTWSTFKVYLEEKEI